MTRRLRIPAALAVVALSGTGAALGVSGVGTLVAGCGDNNNGPHDASTCAIDAPAIDAEFCNVICIGSGATPDPCVNPTTQQNICADPCGQCPEGCTPEPIV